MDAAGCSLLVYCPRISLTYIYALRMPTISTIPHHSPPLTPRKEANLQRFATRLVSASQQKLKTKPDREKGSEEIPTEESLLDEARFYDIGAGLFLANIRDLSACPQE
jgi:hypothetical protein